MLDKKELDIHTTIVNNINSIIDYYAKQDNILLLYAIQQFWVMIGTDISVENLLISHAAQINQLLQRTQDFTQYHNNYMPITLKIALLNVKSTIRDNGYSYIIPVDDIKFKAS